LENPIRILLVDDEEAFTMNLTKLLRLRNFDVAAAFNGLQALDMLNPDSPFDVIVLDVKMPGMDGIQVLRRIKRVCPGSEVIMLTGHATLESGIQAMREGAFDYLMKPCDIEDLCEKINAAYTVESIKRHPVLWPRSIVKEIPSPAFIRLEADDPVYRAIEIFSRKFGGITKDTLYVMDSENRLKGVVTKRDLLIAAQRAQSDPALTWQDLEKTPQRMPSLKVKEVMQPRIPASVGPDENLAEAAKRMIVENVRSMPVVVEGRVAAVIWLQDILRHMEHETD
jgi:CheY-like chemotaxis protein